MGIDDKELCQMWLPQEPAFIGLCKNLIHIQVITMMPTHAKCQYNDIMGTSGMCYQPVVQTCSPHRLYVFFLIKLYNQTSGGLSVTPFRLVVKPVITNAHAGRLPPATMVLFYFTSMPISQAYLFICLLASHMYLFTY